MSLGNKSKAKLVALLGIAGAMLTIALLLFPGAQAATGINQWIEFQGRLLNSQGATVPDGYYNLEFKIYQNGDGLSANDSTGSPAGTLLWTEDYLNYNSQGVQVINGFLSVNLGSINPFGSSINWNQDTLWLSMNVGGTSTTCTTFSACSPDGEMLPMQRLTAAPYALNSNQLGGLSSAQFVQLAQGEQTDASSNTSIYINKTGTGNILDFLSGGSDAFTLNNSGDVLFGSNEVTHSISASTAPAASAGTNLSFSAGAAGSGASALGGGNLTINGGAGGGTNGNGGNVIIDSGAANGTGTNGNVNIGTTNANLISIGNTTGTSGLSVLVGTGNYTLNGVGASTYNLGSTTTSGTISLGGTSETGALTLQGEGVSVALDGSATAPSTLIQSSTNSTATLQVQNNSSNRVFAVDTTNNQAILGQSSHLNGALEFKDSTDTNTITINSTGTNSSYTLNLPNVAPSPGLCLETSPSSSSQLVFVSCSNNNASITEVQEWDTSGSNTLTDNPQNIGDEIVMTTAIPTSGVSVSSVSGGGVSSWTKVLSNNGNSSVNRVEIWVGEVTSVGSATITVTYSSSPGIEEVTATEFTAAGVNGATNWGIDASGSQLNSTASTTVTYPNINSTNSDELYVGYAQVQYAPATAGSTANFSYIVTGIQHNVIAYDLSTSPSQNYQPSASQSSSGESNTAAVMLTAFVSSTAINNSTSLQKANFYVQSATSGTVAGILQAATSGTADILDLKNSAGINVITFGSTGNVTLENSIDSPTALSIQNSNAQNILGVNTTTGQVDLGASTAATGALNFYDAADSNAITLEAPSTIAASYSLSLPSNAPSTGLCLQTSPSNANQLVFTSCAQQVTAASIAFVNDWSAHGNNVTTLTDAPTGLGDLLILYSGSNVQNESINSVSGGGVTSWVKVNGYTNGGGGHMAAEMWRGVVTTTGSNTITVNYSRNAGTNEIAAIEYTIGTSSGTWDVDTSGTYNNNSSTIDFPSLTPTNSSELYSGYAYSANTETAGSTTGYSYISTGASRLIAYNLSVSGGVATRPTASQSPSGQYASVAATIAAYTTGSVIANSTATQEANFNVQAATSGSVAGVLQAASSGTGDIFDARNASGNNVLSINSSTGLTLGTPGTVGGQLNFAGTSNSNTITIAAPSSIGASYTLTLPSSTPTTNMCLTTSPSNASQLVFGSCSSQTTSSPISYVSEWNTNGNGVTTLNDSPSNKGDLMLLWLYPQNDAQAQSVSGGGVSTWTLVTSDTGGFCGFRGSCDEMELWRGVVTTTGSGTITVTYPGGFRGSPGNPNELVAAEYSTGSTTSSWVVDSSGTVANGGSTTVNYPSLTPSDSNDLYAGYAETAYSGGTMSAGSTPGYNYIQTGLGDYIAYDTSVTGTQSPTASVAPSSTSGAAAVLIAAFNTSQTISNSTAIQEANIYIQAANNGSIAGIFQAASGGTADVLDVYNGSGTLVDSIGYTGNLLVEPSTASSSALSVQTTGGVNVFSVDTSGLAVNIGAGATGETTPSLLVLDNQTGNSNDPTEVNGGLYYNATTKTFRCGVDGSWQSCSGLLYSNASASSAVSNCTNNCSAFSTSAAVPANYCQTGRVIGVTNNGYYSTSATSTSLQFGVYYGTSSTTATSDTLIGTLTPSTSTASANNYYYQINMDIICFSTSSMQAEGTLTIQTTSSNTTSMSVLPIASTSATTVTTNSANNLYIFPIWGAASTSNSVTATQTIVNAY